MARIYISNSNKDYRSSVKENHRKAKAALSALVQNGQTGSIGAYVLHFATAVKKKGLASALVSGSAKVAQPTLTTATLNAAQFGQSGAITDLAQLRAASENEFGSAHVMESVAALAMIPKSVTALTASVLTGRNGPLGQNVRNHVEMDSSLDREIVLVSEIAKAIIRIQKCVIWDDVHFGLIGKSGDNALKIVT